MAKTILTAVLIVLLNVLVGCHSVDSGKSQLVPSQAKRTPSSVAVKVPKGSEVDIVEQMTINRQAYRQGLEALIAHYHRTGNNMQLAWAKDELKRLNKIPQYKYIIEASLAGPKLKAKASIPLADYMYKDAVRLEKKAKRLIVYVNEDLLRVALSQYNQLIRQHPTSDKIDDAAYRAAGIYEYFKDYSIALLYYQRAYQWDADTPNPARYKAACILDTHLSRRSEALKLYKQALEKEKLSKDDKEFAEKRIAELTKSGETIKESK